MIERTIDNETDRKIFVGLEWPKSIAKPDFFCKAIAPKNGQVRETKKGSWDKLHPRIVKSSFKVPPNWEVVEQYQHGQVMTDEHGRPRPFRYGQEITDSTHVLKHTCEKPYDECYHGFWGRYVQFGSSEMD